MGPGESACAGDFPGDRGDDRTGLAGRCPPREWRRRRHQRLRRHSGRWQRVHGHARRPAGPRRQDVSSVVHCRRQAVVSRNDGGRTEWQRRGGWNRACPRHVRRRRNGRACRRLCAADERPDHRGQPDDGLLTRVNGPSGTFVTLEGPDGAGKSTQARLLAERIRQTGREVVLTREPGGTALGERLRDVLMHAPAGSHDALSDALLFNAARARQVSEVIRPALERGAVVVCDRFSDSTLAYQGFGGGVPVERLRALAAISIESITPRRTVLVDLPVAAGLERRHTGSSADLTRFETDADEHGAAFHERVRDGYLQMAREEPDRWRVVDGSAAQEDVAQSVWSGVADLFNG